mmetsp:Transcript_119294/g.223083  ORF Transcript_119294/g.223083 Transcript_119294/m.223083 type:complete len:218 (-) Transcript_119294:272-925(-)
MGLRIGLLSRCCIWCIKGASTVGSDFSGRPKLTSVFLLSCRSSLLWPLTGVAGAPPCFNFAISSRRLCSSACCIAMSWCILDWTAKSVRSCASASFRPTKWWCTSFCMEGSSVMVLTSPEGTVGSAPRSTASIFGLRNGRASSSAASAPASFNFKSLISAATDENLAPWSASCVRQSLNTLRSSCSCSPCRPTSRRRSRVAACFWTMSCCTTACMSD